ncbi:hypothetical protein MKW94_003072 [Papaver nudicaule]|uniref:Beta-catenin-like protein 1 N-terminal domain-containing protein n=1 Tax=Papaver nudicaule TaxID=74823 RepID=A0AA42B147_PAPNU|nr:hypothetical protein [Papaver nudicaule]
MASQKRCVPETPDQLQSSFQQTFDDYNKTRKYGVVSDEPCKIADLENKLIKIILKFRTFKLMYPKDYPKIVNLPAMGSMLELLKHDNYCGNRLASYILLASKDLTNDNVLVENQRKGAPLFVESLIELGALDVFVSTLERFRKDDGGGGGDGVFRALQSIAHMIFHQPNVAEAAGKKTELIDLLLDALETPRRDYPKRYAVGLLHTLLLCSMENRRQLGEMGTVAVLLNAISSLEDEDEDEGDDEEYVAETLFRCLFLLLEHLENRVRFADAGGVELMIRIIQSEELGYYYYGSAVAALDIAVKDCQSASEKFVNDAVGLDVAIFPASMDIPPSTMHEQKETEEHLISLIALLTGGIAETQKHILLKKFVENECKIIAWLVELFIRYFKELEALMKRLKDKQLDPSELYNIKLRYGLPTLQLIAVILGYLWSSKRNMCGIYSQYVFKQVCSLLSCILRYEYRDHVGIGGESVEGAAKTVIEEYIDSLEEVSAKTFGRS